jgi:hypothetical protein
MIAVNEYLAKHAALKAKARAPLDKRLQPETAAI